MYSFSSEWENAYYWASSKETTMNHLTVEQRYTITQMLDMVIPKAKLPVLLGKIKTPFTGKLSGIVMVDCLYYLR